MLFTSKIRDHEEGLVIYSLYTLFSFLAWARVNIFLETVSSKMATTHIFQSGTVASWLARSTPERALRVRALAGDIVLCSWARHFTLTVPLSTQVYKWVPANLMLGGNPAMDWHPIQGGVEILSVASCYGNRDKLRRDGPLGPSTDFTRN